MLVLCWQAELLDLNSFQLLAIIQTCPNRLLGWRWSPPFNKYFRYYCTKKGQICFHFSGLELERARKSVIYGLFLSWNQDVSVHKNQRGLYCAPNHTQPEPLRSYIWYATYLQLPDQRQHTWDCGKLIRPCKLQLEHRVLRVVRGWETQFFTPFWRSVWMLPLLPPGAQVGNIG